MELKGELAALVEEARKDPGVWKDDGCGFTGTAYEVDTHIIETNEKFLQDDQIEKIRCWGRTKIA